MFKKSENLFGIPTHKSVSLRPLSTKVEHMETRSDFDIPLETLAREGVHEFKFHLDNGFFQSFETGLIKGGEFDVHLEVERLRNQFNLTIRANGAAILDCDRCLDPFSLPMQVVEEMVIKYSAEGLKEEETVIYVPVGIEHYNVSKLFYDLIGVTLPISSVHDDADLSCNPEMIKYLTQNQVDLEVENNNDKQEIPDDSPWKALRGLNESEN